MTNRKDRLLQLVLSDERIIKKYGIDATEYPTVSDALNSENAIVATIAEIIDSIKDSFDLSDQKALYTKLHRQLNDTLLL